MQGGGATHTKQRKALISDKQYNILKWVCLIFLPALSTAYAALAGIWGLPFAEQIPNSITVIALFLGTLLRVSSAEYNRNKNNGNP